MSKENAIKKIVETLLFLLAIFLILLAYHSNADYNLEQGIDVLSGATQIYEGY